MNTHKEIMDLWSRRVDFAREVGVSENLAGAWYRRENIPAEHWKSVVKAAQARGHTQVTHELLAATVKPRKRRDDTTLEMVKAC
jgi:hypothetical protein